MTTSHDQTHRERRRNQLAFHFGAVCVLSGGVAFAAEPPIVGRPVGYSGAIGGPFVVTTRVDATTVAVEEPFTLTLRIVGAGNLKQIARPPLGKLAGFQQFAVDDLDESFIEGSPPSRTFRYRLRARSAEAKQIPPFKFVYFNPAIVPASRAYQTTYAAGVELNVNLPPAREQGDIAREVAAVRQRLGKNPDDQSARALLNQLRQDVEYSTPDMRPTEPFWLEWRALSHSGKMLAAWSSLFAATIVGWRRRRWMGYFLLAAVSLAVVGLISLCAFLEWRDNQRNAAKPVVVVSQHTVLRRGNGEDYPPRIPAALSPGAEVRRLFERHGWLQVELANGIVGWLPVDSAIH